MCVDVQMAYRRFLQAALRVDRPARGWVGEGVPLRDLPHAIVPAVIRQADRQAGNFKRYSALAVSGLTFAIGLALWGCWPAMERDCREEEAVWLDRNDNNKEKRCNSSMRCNCWSG